MLLKAKQGWVQQPEISNLVQELRCIMQLYLEKSIDELSITFATINRWNNGHATPSLIALAKTEEILHRIEDGVEPLPAKYHHSTKNQRIVVISSNSKVFRRRKLNG